MKHSEEKYVKHILLVRYNVVAALTKTITFSMDMQQLNVVHIFHKFEEYIAYMWRVEDGNSVFYRNVVNINLII
jgi:hypothetical protein